MSLVVIIPVFLLLLLFSYQSSGFPTRSDTNRAVQPQKMTRGLNCRIRQVKRLYYLCSETKGSDLCLWFHIWASSWENLLFAYAKTKTQISFAVFVKLISAFVSATWIVQFIFFLNPKFQASSHLLWQYSPVCVIPGRKSRRPVFSQRGSYAKKNVAAQILWRRIIGIY